VDDRTLKRVLAPSGKGAVGKDAVKISRKDSSWKIVERE
jgi:hypothetical protein